MTNLIVGYGVQGKKRKLFIKDKTIILDKFNAEANFKNIKDVNLKKISHAYICTPENKKFFYIKKLLENDIKILVEKPLNFTNQQFKSIKRILKKKKKYFLYTAYNHRFEPHIINVKKILEQKKIGKIYRVDLYYGNGTCKLWKKSWREKNSHSILYDLGVHLLDIFKFWFDFLPKKFKTITKDRNELKCYDFISFSSKDKFSTTFTTSIINWRNSFRAEILGSKGSLHIDCLCKWGTSVLKIRKRLLPSGLPQKKEIVLNLKDPTWKKEKNFFEKKNKYKFTNIDNDILYSKVINLIKKS